MATCPFFIDRSVTTTRSVGSSDSADAIPSPGAPLSTLTNRTGHPAASGKAGTAAGTPRPLIVTGKLYEEATILRIALAYEQATEWKDKHPTLGS